MPTPSSHVLRFEHQSDSWFAGLPLGNGRTGAMISGGLPTQRLHLNEETFWSPGPRNREFDGARDAMSEVRTFLTAGDVLAAQSAASPLLGRPSLGAALQPIGDVSVSSDLDARDVRVTRTLDLSSGLAAFRWRWRDGRSLTREIVAARAPSIFLIRQKANFTVPAHLSFDSPFLDSSTCVAGNVLLAQGRWRETPKNRTLVADSYRLRDFDGVRLSFAVGITVLEGETASSANGLLCGSRGWTIALAIATDSDGSSPSDSVLATLEQARQPVEELMAGAAAAHAEVYSRASIELTTDDPLASLSTAQRVHAVRAGAIDDHLIVTLANYGRYLQIASTLGGKLPPTLQGIWNPDTEPAWGSNYTLNINLQMSLWSADPFRFPEALDTLQAWVADLSVAGQRTAEELYGADGWVTHHNSDGWLNTAPTTLVEVGLFAGAGPWLVQQLYRHHESYPESVDENALLELLCGLTAFFDSWLTVDEDGYLTPIPSSSPENAYLLESVPRPLSRAVDPEYWRHGWLGRGSTIDVLLVRDTLQSAIELGSRLGSAVEQLEAWKGMLARLRPIVFRHGEVPEWTWPSRALELGHRHLSPLYAVYPGHDDDRSMPGLYDAARRTLINRQANVTSSSNGWGGWSKVWAAACWARLGDGDRAAASLESLLASGITPDSLLHVFPDFDGVPSADAVHQSDANLGFPAAVIEMVLQSAPGTLRLLPAVPSRWSAGRVRSIRAAGGIDVSFTWQHGRVREAQLTSTRDQRLVITAPGCTDLRVFLKRNEPTIVQLSKITTNQKEVSP